MKEKVGEKSNVNIVTLASAKILDESGNPVQMGSLWQKQTALFIFVRHFACIDCRRHAVEVWERREAYERSGARIIFIGNGQPHFIQIFKNELNLQNAPIFTDPTLTVFKAAGFKRGFLAALGPKSIASGLKMFGKGHRQGAFDSASGDVWQMGGVLVVKPSGQIAYHYISEMLGDYPPESDFAADTMR